MITPPHVADRAPEPAASCAGAPAGSRTTAGLPSGQVTWRSIGIVAATAAFCATLTWTVLGPVGGLDLQVDAQGGGTQEVGVIAVLVSSLLMAFLGGVLLRWWQRQSSAGTHHWTVFAGVFTVVSMLGPANALTFADGMALVSLHTVVAAVVIVGLRRASRAFAC
jgi:Family of unknown function (DUF6069)